MKRTLELLKSALSSLDTVGPGNSKAQLLCQIRYARVRLRLAIAELTKEVKNGKSKAKQKG